MNRWLSIAFALLVFSSCATTNTPGIDPAGSALPEDRDYAALEAFLLCLQSDPDLDLNEAGPAGSIVLNVNTPEKTGMLSSDQLANDVRDYIIPPELIADLQKRNCIPGSFDGVPCKFDGRRFSSPILVDELIDWNSALDRKNMFRESRPGARAWVSAYLPGYSADGSQSIVRGWIGPTPHSATATALLKKHGKEWTVVWHHVAYYL